MEKEDWLRLAERLIENTPELITAISSLITAVVAYKTATKKQRKPKPRKHK